MALYSVLRMLIFFGFLCALWLLGLRDESQRWWLLGLSALGSMVLSYFVLQGPRADFSASIARRVGERARRSWPDDPSTVDETAEDAEIAEDAAAGEDANTEDAAARDAASGEDSRA